MALYYLVKCCRKPVTGDTNQINNLADTLATFCSLGVGKEGKCEKMLFEIEASDMPPGTKAIIGQWFSGDLSTLILDYFIEQVHITLLARVVGLRSWARKELSVRYKRYHLCYNIDFSVVSGKRKSFCSQWWDQSSSSYLFLSGKMSEILVKLEDWRLCDQIFLGSLRSLVDFLPSDLWD